MAEYPYVIVGGGMAADAAIRGIRRRDASGPIAVFTREPFPPYQKPPLSKKLWLDLPTESLWLSQWQRQAGVDLRLNTPVVAIDPVAHTLTDRRGDQTRYGKLLIATGGEPRRTFGESPAIFYVGTYLDHLRLWRRLNGETRQILVVGGGFIGAEMSAVLASRGHQVTWAFPQSGPLADRFPDPVVTHLTAVYTSHGVTLIAGQRVTDIVDTNEGVEARLETGGIVRAELAVVGIGWTYATDWLSQAGLQCQRGVLVDAFLRTSQPDIFAAGDIAEQNGHPLMPHEDHAVTQGYLAGQNLVGPLTAYEHQPFFYSDMFHLGYEAVGTIDSRLDTVIDWVVPGEEGVIYYLQDRRVVGIVNWNVWDGIPAARKILQYAGPIDPGDLPGRIRNR
ncbi:FAD-dependent pyridine nucleotide-disulfide oxidoreductase [Sulfobacillus acidophilus TPY]|uniref:Monodehydroascorbate reductase (NADH) n=1 Tax=Sulfobacillus acidophilus (strain ATCC 700253 / DSM 10332 / NAL) TaxID=679936 RepID=G8U037_SULAD|nr:FAD-dependent pyridine nucleotide-disulfide oxidoreductase [Sulfobacillus acidophilus TPY]AEW05286.1 Monodehydroascorbate reductase (NADH) [Sulfobacillus acidophilus DSM 10332]